MKNKVKTSFIVGAIMLVIIAIGIGIMSSGEKSEVKTIKVPNESTNVVIDSIDADSVSVN